MALPSLDPAADPTLLDPAADPTLDLTRSARLLASPRAERGSARPHRPSPSSPEAAPAPETTPETAADRRIAARGEPPSSAPGKRTRRPKSERPARKLILDVKAVADVDGLEQEVAVLRASIRQLANNGDMDVHVKVLAELRHQIEALCRALKTQQSLEGSDGDGRTAEMRRVLEELGDDLGVAR